CRRGCSVRRHGARVSRDSRHPSRRPLRSGSSSRNAPSRRVSADTSCATPARRRRRSSTPPCYESRYTPRWTCSLAPGQCRTADVILHVNTAKAEFCRLAQRRHRKNLGLVPFPRERHHLLARESARRGLECPLLFGEVEV